MKRLTIQPQSTKNFLTANFLGGVKLVWNGRNLTDFATLKVLGLFCYLLDNAEQPVSREKLTTMFWGDSPESQARYNLRYALWNIRKLFKETEDDIDPFIASRTTCQMHPDFQFVTDCQQFLEELDTRDSNTRADALVKAVERYHGPFLDGFTIRNLPDWEEWLYHRREELQKRYLEGMIEVGNEFLLVNQSSKALDIFMRVLTVANDLEPAHEGIIRAYADQGKTSAALRQYNVYVDVMKREFNAPPRAEMVKLAEILRSGGEVTPAPIEEKPQRQTAPSVVMSAAVPTTEPVTITLGEPHPSLTTSAEQSLFVGRDSEMQSLHQLVEQVTNGNGQVLIVSGEMGIGKTRLLSAFLMQIPKRFLVGIGESQEIATTQPLETIDQVCEGLLSDNRVPKELREEYSLIGSSFNASSDNDAGTEAAILEAKRRWVIKLAQVAPVLLLIDDLHWASDSVLTFFANLAQEVKRLPMLLIGIFRTYENVGEDVIAPALISIARTGRLWRIELKKLTESETLQLIAAKASNVVDHMRKEELERLTRFTNGIPLYAVELANFLQEGREEIVHSPVLEDRPDFESASGEKVIPPLMERIAALRLSKCTPVQIELLRTTAQIVGDFSVKLLNHLKDLDEETLEEILVDLEGRNFIHHIERGDDLIFAFNHQMVKLAIADTVPSLERRRLFKSIVTAYNESGDPCSPEAMAYYLFNSGDRVAALPFLMQSARQWFAVGEKRRGLQNSRFAYKIAMENLSADPDKMVDIVVEHANQQVRLDMVKPALDVLNDLIGQLEPTTSSTKTESKNLIARREELREMLKTPQRKNIRLVSPLLLVTTKRSLANVKLLQDDADGAQALVEQAEKMLDELEDSPAAILESGRILQLKAKLLIRQKKRNEAVRVLANSVELLRVPGAEIDLAESYLLLSQLSFDKRDWIRAKDYLETATDLSLDSEDELLQTNCYYLLGKYCERREEFEDAEVYLKTAVEIGERALPNPVQLANMRLDYAVILQQNKKLDDARSEIEKAEESLRTESNEEGLQRAKQIRAELKIA